MNSVSVQAPAKVNLYLHVTGRRADGYHLLDSLFVFTEHGDKISVQPSEKLSFEITGEYANALPSNGEGNIVLKAAEMLAAACGMTPDVKITLEKNLPVASGIGGGSADAAATLKSLTKLWKLNVSRERLLEIALKLGADVPSCLDSKAVQVSGIGDVLTSAPAFPPLFVVLVNPNKPVSTPAVFKSRAPVFSAPAPFTHDETDFDAFIEALKRRTNDLCEAACRIEPSVSLVLQALEDCPQCRLARMSGSGGTCFGLFSNAKDALDSCGRIRNAYPQWWLLNTRVA